MVVILNVLHTHTHINKTITGDMIYVAVFLTILKNTIEDATSSV